MVQSLDSEHNTEKMPEKVPLSQVLPPLIFGAGVFNQQHNKDPHSLNVTELILEALSLGVRAFDTSPYYGPSEELLGSAFETAQTYYKYNREDLTIITKVGRLGNAEFDYSPLWIRQSIQRSLARLKTDYIDVVYCHDVEFVSQNEVLDAVNELRRLRDDAKIIKYIGISGYPINIICELAEQVKDKTGEPLDVVMSYANFTVQNTLLASIGVQRLMAAGVDVVPNASPLGMGFLRSKGPPIETCDFHPASNDLRVVVKKASDFCVAHGEQIELVAIRYALENWLLEGSPVGSSAHSIAEFVGTDWSMSSGKTKIGVSVVGISNIKELLHCIRIWRSILAGIDKGQETRSKDSIAGFAHLWSLNRRNAVKLLAAAIKDIFGEWFNYTWHSPSPDYANIRQTHTNT